MGSQTPNALTAIEYHTLLALGDGALHGYAIGQAIERESDGAVRPKAGSLYRVLARLITWGYVAEAREQMRTEPHPGLDRKYYELSPNGRRALENEARRMRHATRLAGQRLGLQDLSK